jgi:hypothetical protein
MKIILFHTVFKTLYKAQNEINDISTHVYKIRNTIILQCKDALHILKSNCSGINIVRESNSNESRETVLGEN